MNPPSRARIIAAWVLTGLLTFVFFSSAAFKFIAAPQVLEGFEKYGLKDQRLLIATGETVSALLFLIPVTNSLGVLLLSAYMGGAILTHMSHGEPYVAQSIILVLIWVAAYLRHPTLLQSFRGRAG
jgi:hypothetical protein